jgi:hypothetical protein
VRPWRAQGDCCWYHGATGHRSPVGRYGWCARRRRATSPMTRSPCSWWAEADGVSPWELAALDSLVDPTVGIFVERDGTRSIYVNGQHRAQAMLDAGVRRTLVVRYWEDCRPSRPGPSRRPGRLTMARMPAWHRARRSAGRQRADPEGVRRAGSSFRSGRSGLGRPPRVATSCPAHPGTSA